MLYQSRHKKYRNVGNRSNLSSNHSGHHFRDRKNQLSEASNWQKSRTQSGQSQPVPDSLKSFQEELTSLIKLTHRNKASNRSTFLPTLKTEKVYESTEIRELKSEMQGIKSLLLQRKQKKSIEDKLQKIIISLQTQNQMRRIQTQRTQLQTRHQLMQPQQQIPIMMPQPQILYPPPPYYQPYQSYHLRKNRRRRRRYKNSPESEQDEQIQQQKQRTKSKNKVKPSKKPICNPKLRRKLRIIMWAAAVPIFLQSQAKKKAALRRKDIESFCKQKFYIEIGNVKEWLLQTQKISFSIILQKKNLNFSYFDETSSKVRQQKLNLIMNILATGLKDMVQLAKPKKIQAFSQFISKLCLNKSYPINSLWAESQMALVSVSQTYGFFKLDENLEKFLIGLLVFVKIFIFNMLLQPFKFDNQNFSKKAEPMTTNMKLIGSIYYLLVKEVLDQYLSSKRSKTLYKIGNYDKAQMSKIKYSQPLVYGKSLGYQKQYISGLFDEEAFKQLKQYKFWSLCVENIKQVIDKIHSSLKTNF